jgi:hypothetical protein
LFIVSVESKHRHSQILDSEEIHPHAGLERNTQVAIVLHVRLVEDQVRIAGGSLGPRVRVYQ